MPTRELLVRRQRGSSSQCVGLSDKWNYVIVVYAPNLLRHFCPLFYVFRCGVEHLCIAVAKRREKGIAGVQLWLREIVSCG